MRSTASSGSSSNVARRIRDAIDGVLRERETASQGNGGPGDSANRDTVRACLDALCAVLGCSVGHAYFVDDQDPGLLIPSGVWSMGSRLRSRLLPFQRATTSRRLRVGLGLPGVAVRAGRPIAMHELGEAVLPRGVALVRSGLREGLAVPLRSGGRVVGVLEMYSDCPPPHDPDVLEALTEVGDLLGDVLSR